MRLNKICFLAVLTVFISSVANAAEVTAVPEIKVKQYMIDGANTFKDVEIINEKWTITIENNTLFFGTKKFQLLNEIEECDSFVDKALKIARSAKNEIWQVNRACSSIDRSQMKILHDHFMLYWDAIDIIEDLDSSLWAQDPEDGTHFLLSKSKKNKLTVFEFSTRSRTKLK